MKKWYYARDGQQHGPVPAAELLRLSSTGAVDLSSAMVWTDGMIDWVSATSVPELNGASGISAPPSSAAPAPIAETPASTNPYAAPASSWSEAPVSPVGDLPFVKPANYALFASTTAIGLIGIMAGLGLIFINYGSSDQTLRIAFVIFGLSTIALIIGTVFAMIYQYRAWVLLQPHTSYSTPGKAVGFQFIPLFSFYWYFIAYWRWSQEWNRLIISNPKHQLAPRANEGLFLSYAILQAASIAVGALASLPMVVVYFIIMKNVCDAVNYGASTSRAQP